MVESREVEVSNLLPEIFGGEWQNLPCHDKMVAYKVLLWCSDNTNRLVDSLGESIEDELTRKIDEVLEMFYQVTFKEVMLRGRKREWVDFRNMLAHIYWEISGQTLSRVARKCGKCHSTLIHSFRDLRYQIEHSKNYRRGYELLKYRILAKIHEQ